MDNRKISLIFKPILLEFIKNNDMRTELINLSNNPIGMRGLDGLLEEARYFIKGIVREAFEEIWDERNYSPIMDTPLLTTGELCKRWNITPDTLHNWEKQGKIAKMPLGGRKKMYSLKDVEEAEVSGIVIAKAS